MRISDPLGLEDEPDYEDARCEDCGAGPDQTCTDECECEHCQHTKDGHNAEDF